MAKFKFASAQASAKIWTSLSFGERLGPEWVVHYTTRQVTGVIAWIAALLEAVS